MGSIGRIERVRGAYIRTIPTTLKYLNIRENHNKNKYTNRRGIMKDIFNGDLIDLAKKGYFDVIVHGCNCFNKMDSGLALQIKNYFPEAYEADSETIKGDINKLGTYSFAFIEDYNLTVINAYTQYDYGKDGKLMFKYEEFRKILQDIAINFKDKRIGLPLIGCGSAGATELAIKGIILKELEGMDYKICILK
jgi:O-acetyl-ADP-ribose deacetylase (regulator of RNase III)